MISCFFLGLLVIIKKVVQSVKKNGIIWIFYSLACLLAILHCTLHYLASLESTIYLFPVRPRQFLNQHVFVQ